jgi:hypothetical protein
MNRDRIIARLFLIIGVYLIALGMILLVFGIAWAVPSQSGIVTAKTTIYGCLFGGVTTILIGSVFLKENLTFHLKNRRRKPKVHPAITSDPTNV